MTFDEAVSYLLSLGHETLAVKLGLANVRSLLAAEARAPQKSADDARRTQDSKIEK